MTKLYIFWQEQDTRRWHPVGMLTRTSEGHFEFKYTRGANMVRGFVPFGRMDDLHKTYLSTELFPLFANRVLSRSRPEYQEYVRWIGAESDRYDPMLILSRTGGERATDSLLVYPKPEANERCELDLAFLCHGIRHLPQQSIDHVGRLNEGDLLYPMLDILNPFDGDAVGLRTADPVWFVGYVPRFFAKEIKTCIQATEPHAVRFRVARVNPDAPLQLRLLCRFTAPWPTGFQPWSEPEYQPLVGIGAGTRHLHESRTAAHGRAKAVD